MVICTGPKDESHMTPQFSELFDKLNKDKLDEEFNIMLESRDISLSPSLWLVLQCPTFGWGADFWGILLKTG